ncbi:hypothetical protein Tco_0519599, partial [Tanacetum coccineum]
SYRAIIGSDYIQPVYVKPRVLIKYREAEPANNDSTAQSEFCIDSFLAVDILVIMDIRYKDKTICSKVIWGISNADGFNGWFSNCPFRIDLFTFSDRGDEDHDVLSFPFKLNINDNKERKYVHSDIDAVIGNRLGRLDHGLTEF